jgi:predicted ATPase
MEKKMTQEDIMIFLDKNAGCEFTYREIANIFEGTMTVENVCRALNKIARREEYHTQVIILHGKKTTVYSKPIEVVNNAQD